jgi:hypothetical protein
VRIIEGIATLIDALQLNPRITGVEWRVCGCTDRHSCNSPCHRVEENLCSTCLEAAQAVLYWRQSALKPDRNALWME